MAFFLAGARETSQKKKRKESVPGYFQPAARKLVLAPRFLARKNKANERREKKTPANVEQGQKKDQANQPEKNNKKNNDNKNRTHDNFALMREVTDLFLEEK